MNPIKDLTFSKFQVVVISFNKFKCWLSCVSDLKEQRDWSDHAIWWPDRNQWLKRTGSTLDQCHVQADAKLQFTPMHKTLRVQMPDMQLIDMRVDFSSDVLSSVIELCKEVGKGRKIENTV